DRITLTGALPIATIVNAGAGNDTVDGTAATAGFTALGGAGGDTLVGGSAGDRLEGGDGKDDLSGGSDGADILLGGADSDILRSGAGTPTDIVDGWTGDDILQCSSGAGLYTVGSGATTPVVFILGPTSNTNSTDVETIRLSSTLNGSYQINDLSGSSVTEVAVETTGDLNSSVVNFLAGTLTLSGTVGDDN